MIIHEQNGISIVYQNGVYSVSIRGYGYFFTDKLKSALGQFYALTGSVVNLQAQK